MSSLLLAVSAKVHYPCVPCVIFMINMEFQVHDTAYWYTMHSCFENTIWRPRCSCFILQTQVTARPLCVAYYLSAVVRLGTAQHASVLPVAISAPSPCDARCCSEPGGDMSLAWLA